MAFPSSTSLLPTPPPSTGCWADLQPDVLLSVFTRTRQSEVLHAAGLTCAPWWRLARHEPALWRRIDLTMPCDHEDEELTDDDMSGDHIPVYTYTHVVKRDPQEVIREETMKGRWKAFALAAVDRSAGQCEAFRGRADDEVLLYLADMAPCLKSLSVTCHYDVYSEAFSDLIKKFPLLEELELVLHSDGDGYRNKKNKQPGSNSWADLLQSASEACQHLQRFTVQHAGRGWRADSYYQRGPKASEKPFSIQTMPGLRSLELFGDSFTKDTVLHIVQNCPVLGSLDITNVPGLSQYVDELRNKCSGISVRIQAYDSEDEDGGCCCCSFFDY